ncbi:kinase-like protein [Ramicandelaber brevisporus]|nr:kinase-like protein [Ramicandelaber brevisporus]
MASLSRTGAVFTKHKKPGLGPRVPKLDIGIQQPQQQQQQQQQLFEDSALGLNSGNNSSGSTNSRVASFTEIGLATGSDAYGRRSSAEPSVAGLGPLVIGIGGGGSSGQSTAASVGTMHSNDSGLISASSVGSSSSRTAFGSIADPSGLGGEPIKLSLDLFELREHIGEGSVGVVKRAVYLPTSKVVAIKKVSVDDNPETHKQLNRELSILLLCKSSYIVPFFGWFIDNTDNSLYMAMENCGGGSLHAIYKHLDEHHGGRRIEEPVLGRITFAVVNALIYLRQQKFIHRDIKPSNILATSRGEIKLCDFSVSGTLENSIANTFTGTSAYMSPERIQGAPYTSKSDIWSLGLTLHELANARFPFPPDGSARELAAFELIQYITCSQIPPLLCADDPVQPGDAGKPRYSREMCAFVAMCIAKRPDDRPVVNEQLLSHPFLVRAANTPVDMQKWIETVWGLSD